MKTRNKLAANGDAIRTIRQLKGWSVRNFARTVPMSESHLSNVENGRRDLSPEKLLAVARALGVSIGAITAGSAGPTHIAAAANASPPVAA